MNEVQLATLAAAVFMSGANPLPPEDAAEKAKNLVRAMSMAMTYADDAPAPYREDVAVHTEEVRTTKTYFE